MSRQHPLKESVRLFPACPDIPAVKPRLVSKYLWFDIICKGIIPYGDFHIGPSFPAGVRGKGLNFLEGHEAFSTREFLRQEIEKFFQRETRVNRSIDACVQDSFWFESIPNGFVDKLLDHESFSNPTRSNQIVARRTLKSRARSLKGAK